MKDLSLALYLLRELEATPAGLSSDELHAKIGAAGLPVPDKRTVQRMLADFSRRGIRLLRKGRRLRLESSGANLTPTLTLVRALMLDKSFTPNFYGDFSVRRGLDYFAHRSDVVALFYDLTRAIRDERVVTFRHTAQNHESLWRINLPTRQHGARRQTKAVRLLPRFLVTGGNSFLVLGEAFAKKSFYRNDFSKPVCRHYELRGVEDLTIHEREKAQLTIDPAQLYRNSLSIWVGGEEYEVHIEELWLGDQRVRRRKLKVNGEDEILSLVASSLGRMRVINPPEGLVMRADEIGLPHELLFRFE